MSISLPTLVAHRGLHDIHPENSLGAFAAAWHAGLHWVECDVHAAGDGEFVVFHDDTLGRLTCQSGTLAGLESSALRRLWLRNAAGHESDQGIPTLSELLSIIPAHGRLLLEIKPRLDASAMRRLLGLLDPGRCVVQSFLEPNLVLARQLGPDFALAWLIDKPEQIALAAAATWPAINAHHRLLNAASAALLKARGLAVGTWTVNTPDDLRAIARLGCSNIISDSPLEMQRLLPYL